MSNPIRAKYPLVSSCATGYATPPRQAEVNVNAGNRGTAPPADPGRARRTKGYVASGGSFSSGTRASGDGQGRRLGPRPRADNGLERAHAAHGAPLVGRVRQRRGRGGPLPPRPPPGAAPRCPPPFGGGGGGGGPPPPGGARGR